MIFTPKAKMGGDGMVGSVPGIITMVQNLQLCVAPTPAQLEGYSDLARLCLKRAEAFYSMDVKVEGPEGNGALVVKKLTGIAAIQALFKDIKEKMSDSDLQNTVNIDMVQPLKAFKWLLTKDEVDESKGWVMKICDLQAKAGGSNESAIVLASQAKSWDKGDQEVKDAAKSKRERAAGIRKVPLV